MALCAVGTAPNITAYLSRESVVQSVPTASPLTSCTRLSRSTRPLRPPASLLHNALFCEVVTSHCAGFVLCCLPLRALRVKATGVMQSGLRWSRSHSRLRFPVVARPTRRRLRALVVVVAPWHWSGAARCVLGQWPAASHVVCAPAHPCASPLRGISP